MKNILVSIENEGEVSRHLQADECIRIAVSATVEGERTLVKEWLVIYDPTVGVQVKELVEDTEVRDEMQVEE